jgi:hypothetical protein
VGLEWLIGDIENKLCPNSQSTNLSQTGISRQMKWEAQRAVNEKKVVNMEGYKQVQSDTRHLLNIRGITSNVTRHMAQVLRKFSNLS